MRIPWIKSKGEQLDLLDATAAAPNDPIGLAQPSIDSLDVGALPLPPSCDTAALDVVAGQALLVPVERLHEDIGNPRTEFPEARLGELAEDIRQHGILQPIVVHPADASGNHRIHFGAMRLRAAKRAGLLLIPIVVRAAPADPYAQVAENQKRCPLQPVELARFIRVRSQAGDSNATIAKQLGMDQTSVAHHLALLELPPELDEAFRTGRCTSPRTLYELSQLHAEQPAQVNAMVSGEGEITRSMVAALRSDAARTGLPRVGVPKSSHSLMEQAIATCKRLEALVLRIKSAGHTDAQVELTALRQRLADMADRLD
jgi:ParB family chromosome partitioning protein